MKCSDFEGLLSDYLENELENSAFREMEKHLESCASCSTLMAEVKELRASLDCFPWIEPSEDLVRKILDRTSGQTCEEKKLWSPIMAWFKPVLTQRHVFATLMILVFFSFATNMLGPEFTASGQSGLNPAFWGEHVTSFSGDLYKKWREFDSFKHRVGDEIGLLKDDLLGRLDYHLTMALFRSYEESMQEESEHGRTAKETEETKTQGNK